MTAAGGKTNAFSNPGPPSSCRSLLVSFLTGLVVFLAGCSGGGGGTDAPREIDAAVLAVEQAIHTDAEKWASEVASTFAAQVAASGNVDDTALNRDLNRETATLSAALCEAVNDQADDLALDDSGADSEAALLRSIEEALMVELGSHPEVLVAIGMTTWGAWPPFMLKEPKPAPDMAVEGLPASLHQYVKPEFLTDAPALKIPVRGDSSYEDFQQWYMFDQSRDNALFEQASFTTTEIRQKLRDCT